MSTDFDTKKLEFSRKDAYEYDDEYFMQSDPREQQSNRRRPNRGRRHHA